MRRHLVAALVVTVAAAATALAVAGSSKPHVSGAQLSRAARAATAAAGGGFATVSWDASRSAWLMVAHGPNHRTAVVEVASAQAPARDDDGAAEARESERDDSESAVPASDRDRAAQAALEAVGGGTVEDVDRDGEGGATWEVEVVAADGRSVDVLLDAQFRVLSTDGERDSGERDDDSGKPDDDSGKPDDDSGKPDDDSGKPDNGNGRGSDDRNRSSRYGG